MSSKRKATDIATNESKKPRANGSITSFFGPPKTVATNTKGTTIEKKTEPGKEAETKTETEPQPAPAKWDKEAWVSKLTDTQKELLTLEIETLHESWLKELKDEVCSKEFLELKKFLAREKEQGKKIFPPLADVYSWSRHTPLDTVKAVIIGQDPYHNINQAHGLSFSVRAPTPAPPSLKNIYKALAIDYPSFRPPPKNGGLLTPWADRGVLLLNTCLTVRAHEANSHSNRGWERFTQKVIDVVAAKGGGGKGKGVVFLAWGTPAGKRVGKVDGRRHCVLKSVHPSPLSASRGWFECGHFRKTNEWLVENHGVGSEIDWDLGVPAVEAGI